MYDMIDDGGLQDVTGAVSLQDLGAGAGYMYDTCNTYAGLHVTLDIDMISSSHAPTLE